MTQTHKNVETDIKRQKELSFKPTLKDCIFKMNVHSNVNDDEDVWRNGMAMSEWNAHAPRKRMFLRDNYKHK